ncbi:hypothetical protein ACXWPL_09700, partial [Streptococcus pyogenes]
EEEVTGQIKPVGSLFDVGCREKKVMSRRFRPEKREIQPDLRYDNLHVSMFVNRLMYDGKKSVAQSLIYDSFDMIEERAGRPGV